MISIAVSPGFVSGIIFSFSRKRGEIEIVVESSIETIKPSSMCFIHESLLFLELCSILSRSASNAHKSLGTALIWVDVK